MASKTPSKTPSKTSTTAKAKAATTTTKRPARKVKEAPAAASQELAHSVDEMLEIGRRVLGIADLRPGQREGLEHVLARRDVLAIMPTGAGKSLLYQLPSIALGGLVVVVSPLLALITDQVEKLRTRGATALRIDSTITPKQRKDMIALAGKPGGKLLLTTPERMADPEFRAALKDAVGPKGIRLFVCDEAHCVSQWGHDFRPSYLMLRQAIADLGHPPVLATTATAPPHVKEDILHQLGIEDASVVTTSFARPNLQYEVIALDGEDDKKKLVLALVKKLKRPGIIYCATVKTVDDLAEELGRHGLPIAQYHGRMTKAQREDQQEKFMAVGSDQIMVATNAFGLGVDKADIRWVMHYHVPGSLEQYAQEAGRGGRDGKPSRCVLLFSPDDVAIQEYFLSGTYPRQGQVMDVVAALAAWGGEGRPPTIAELAASSGCGQSRTRTVLALAKEEGWVVETDGRFQLSDPPPAHEVVRAKAKEYEKRRIADRRRLDALLDYVRVEGCRSKEILSYLGEEDPPGCGRCDNDLKPAVEARAQAVRATALEDAIRRRRDLEDGIEPAPSFVKTRKTRTKVIDLDLQAADAKAAASASASSPASASTSPSAPVRPAHAVASASAPAPVVDELAALIAEQEADAAAAKVSRKKAPAPEPEPEPEPEAPEIDDATDLAADAADDDDDDEPLGEDEEWVDDDEEDDDEEDDDDLGRTAAEIAADDSDLPEGEITVLKRKKKPKPPKQRPAHLQAAPTDGQPRKKRRRRRKKRKVIPPRSAFTSPVLVVEPGGRRPSHHPIVRTPAPQAVQAAPTTDGDGASPPVVHAPPPLAPRPGRGPVIEYVRSTMKIASAPVASATPNDGVRRQDRGGGGGGGQRRGGGFGGPGGGGNGRPMRRGWSGDGGGGGGEGAGRERGRGRDRNRSQQARGGAPRPPQGQGPQPQQTAPQGLQAGAQPGMPNDGRRRKRRRRGKSRGGGDPQQQQQPQSPVLGFWHAPEQRRPQNPPQPGAPGAPSPPGEGRRRRRRRRRGGGGGGGGAPQGSGGPSGGTPPSTP